MANMRPTVEEIRGLGNFTQMFRWKVTFGGKFSSNIGAISTDEINVRAVSCTSPKKTGESTTISIRGNEVRQPGIYKWESPITLILVEAIDNKVKKFLWEWYEKCWESMNSSTGKTQKMEDLECDITLEQLNNLDEVIYSYKLFGCYLESASLGDFDSETADPQKPELSIAYQRAEFSEGNS